MEKKIEYFYDISNLLLQGWISAWIFDYTFTVSDTTLRSQERAVGRDSLMINTLGKYNTHFLIGVGVVKRTNKR